MDNAELHSTVAVARACRVSTERIRMLRETGRLEPALVEHDGRKRVLYRRGDLEAAGLVWHGEPAGQAAPAGRRAGSVDAAARDLIEEMLAPVLAHLDELHEHARAISSRLEDISPATSDADDLHASSCLLCRARNALRRWRSGPIASRR